MTPFLDTNVLVYANSGDPRQGQALECLRAGGVISAQVLNEFANVLRRKQKKEWDEINDAIDDVLAVLAPPLPITLALHRHGLALARDHQLQFYDALVLASALSAGCDELLTEDMQHGRRIDGLLIRNPFV